MSRLNKISKINNSQAIDQAEIQNAKQDMNTDQGSMGSFQNSTGINQSELQEARRKVQESGMKNNTLS